MTDQLRRQPIGEKENLQHKGRLEPAERGNRHVENHYCPLVNSTRRGTRRSPTGKRGNFAGPPRVSSRQTVGNSRTNGHARRGLRCGRVLPTRPRKWRSEGWKDILWRV